jgi:hypothetical protein
MKVTARLLPHVLSKGRSMMKRALIAMASVGILAVTVVVESGNAQVVQKAPPGPAYPPQSPWPAYNYTLQSPWPAYTPQSRVGVPLGARRFPYPDSPAATGGGSLGYNQLRRW